MNNNIENFIEALEAWLLDDTEITDTTSIMNEQ